MEKKKKATCNKKKTKKGLNVDAILLKNRNIFLNDEINYESSKIIIKNLIALDLYKKDNIHMFINSPGGYVSCGLAIIDTMESIKSKVVTVINSQAASMAGIVSVCGDARLMSKYSTWMSHDVSGGVGYDYLSKAECRIEHVKWQRKILIEILKNKTKLNNSDLEKAMNGELWLDYKKCKEKGIIDK